MISIEDNAFNNCSGLTSVTNQAKVPQKIHSATFSTYGTLHVIPGCKDAYEVANYWKNFTIVEDAEAPILVNSVTLDNNLYMTKPGETVTIISTIKPSDADNNYLKWTSSDESIATVTDGVVKGIAGGMVTITAEATDGSDVKATCKVIVDGPFADYNNYLSSSYTGQYSMSQIGSYITKSIGFYIENVGTESVKIDKVTIYKTNGTLVGSTSDQSLLGTLSAGNKISLSFTVHEDISLSSYYYVWNYTYKGKSCVKKSNESSATIPVCSVTLDTHTATLKATEKVTLKTNILPTIASNKEIAWTSSDTKIATVDDNGVVTAVAVGKATIKATSKYDSKIFDECEVTVEATPVESIQLSKSEVELEEGESVTLTATVSPTTATVKDLTWNSSNTTVATVSNGVVKALKEGNATITAMAKDGSGVKASAKITVKHTVLVSSISFSKDIQIIKPNETLTLTPTISPADATDKTLQWTSSNIKVATVTNGVVKGISGGMVTITAKAMDKSNVSASCKVIVDGPITGGSTETIPVCSLELDTHNKTMKVSEKVSLTANILPTIASNKQVTWSSSDTKVAMVNASGLVIATGIGKATIKATSKYDSKIFDECEVTVEATPVESIQLSKNDVKLEEGESVTLTTTVSPATATVKDVTWTSSNEDVAMVSKSGKVLAVKAGTATITAMATDGSGVKATATVTVTPVTVKSIALNHTSYSLEKGENVTLELTIAPANAANKKVTWSSSNEDVVMVSSTGRCICLGEGTATVTATTTDGSNLSATCVFNCTDGIITITMDDDSDIKVYDIEGRKLGNLKKGVNIIRMDDGTTRKVVKK